MQLVFIICFRRVLKIAKSDYLLRHVRPPVRPYGTTRLSLDGFSRIFLYLRIFIKSVDKIQVSLKSEKN